MANENERNELMALAFGDEDPRAKYHSPMPGLIVDTLKPHSEDLSGRVRNLGSDFARLIGHPDPHGVGDRTAPFLAGLTGASVTAPGLLGLLALPAYQGAHEATEGVLSGDLGKTAVGGATLGLSALPGAAMAKSAAGEIAAARGAREAAIAKQGPWGWNDPDQMVRAFYDEPTRAMGQAGRNPINASHRREVMDRFASPPTPAEAASRNAEQEADWVLHRRNFDNARRNYNIDVAPESSYGRDVSAGRQAALNPATSDQSIQLLNAQYRDAIEKGRSFVRPQIVPNDGSHVLFRNPFTGSEYGYTEVEKRIPGVLYEKNPDPAYTRAFGSDRSFEERMHREYGRPKPKTPAEALADDVQLFLDKNENIPGIQAQGSDIASRLRTIEAAQRPHREVYSNELENWDKVTGFGHNSDLFHNAGRAEDYKGRIGNYDRFGHRYLDDARALGLNTDTAHSFPLEETLKGAPYHVNPRDPKSIEAGYQQFLADEAAKRAAGKLTVHDEFASQEAAASRADGLNRYGLDSENPAHKEALHAAYDKDIAEMRGSIAKIKGELGLAPKPNRPSAALKPLDLLGKYGPPGVVIGGTGVKVAKDAKDAFDQYQENKTVRDYNRSLRGYNAEGPSESH